MEVKKLNICMLAGVRSPHMRVAPQVGICSYLANFGHRVTWVISSNDKHQAQPFFINEAEVYAAHYRHYIPGNSILAKIFNEILNAIKRMRLALKIFKERKYNIIVSRDNIFDGLIAAYIKKRYKVPSVLVLSNPVEQEWEGFKIEAKKPRFLYYLIARFNRFIITFLLREADLILPISKALKDHLVKQGVEESKMMPLSEGIDIEAFWDKDGEDVRRKYHLNDLKVTIYIGTMDKPRQLSVLIHALSRVRRNNQKVKLLMVGEGSDKENLKRLANELGMKDNTIFTGPVPQSQVPDFIAAANIGISPVPPLSFYKLSSPIKIFEYMAMGKPVVANKEIPEHKKVLEQSGGGVLTPFTVEAFADAMIELLDNPEKAANLGQKGKEWIVKNRSYEILAKQVEKRLLGLLGDSS